MNALQDTLEKFARLSGRERLLLVFAIAALIYFALDAALLAPQQKRIKQINLAAQTARTERDTINTALAKMDADAARFGDPLSSQRAELARLREQVAAAEIFYTQGGQSTSALLPLVHELVSAHPGVSLTGLKTLPAAPLGLPARTGAASEPAAPQNAVYRAGIDVTLKGSYPALLAYLRDLEKRSERLFWSDTRLDAAWPEATLRLIIHTIGEDGSAPLQ